LIPDPLVRFGLEFNPFLKNSRDILIETSEFKEALFRLNYLTSTKGFGLLTGAPGLGKTTVIRHFSDSLNPSLYKVCYSAMSTLTVMDFYRSLVDQLGLIPSYRKTDNFKIIQAEVSRLALDKRITPVFIIDEANYVSNAILNDLKMLFNFDMDSRDRAVVLLSGLPVLNHTLSLNIHEPLRQRIVMNYNLDVLSKDEGRSYILKKLSGAGCSQKVFEDNAIEAILNASGGVPRMINKLCASCLLIGANQSLNILSVDTAMQAISDAELG